MIENILKAMNKELNAALKNKWVSDNEQVKEYFDGSIDMIKGAMNRLKSIKNTDNEVIDWFTCLANDVVFLNNHYHSLLEDLKPESDEKSSALEYLILSVEMYRTVMLIYSIYSAGLIAYLKSLESYKASLNSER